MPTRPGEHRKTDRRDAIRIAQDFRDGRLVLIHIPTEEDERVRDLVRCRETFQREIIKSRHYILRFLRRRGFIYRDGTASGVFSGGARTSGRAAGGDAVGRG